MADHRRVKKSIRGLQRVKTWQLLILLIIVGFMAATFLRLNNIGMAQRREAVLAADKSGEESVIQGRLYDLQRYASSHMNANTGAIYLEQEYRRDSQEAIERASNDDNPNGNINAKADAVCKPQYEVWSQAYVQCFVSELSKYPAAENPVDEVKFPDTNLYRFDFAAPRWSPDFAGFSLLLAGVIVLMIIARIISLIILRAMLKHHYRGI